MNIKSIVAATALLFGGLGGASADTYDFSYTPSTPKPESLTLQ
jgi:hypothetical protein